MKHASTIWCIMLENLFKSIEQELGDRFIRIHLDKEEFNIFELITDKLRQIKQSPNQLTKHSTKKSDR